MRTTRSGIALIACTLGVALIAVPGLPAQQQADQLYPATLSYGTGLIDIPVAWVSPTSGDIWLATTGRHIPYSVAGQQSLNTASQWNTNLAIDSHWGGRVSVGFSLYSQNPEWGFFGQVLALKEQADKPWPAIAVGFRNLGNCDHEERFLIGCDISFTGGGAAKDVTSSFATHFHTAPTVYGVATRSFRLGSGSGSLSLGFGSGVFYDNGKLGDSYNDKGQIARGLFLGGRYAINPTPNTRIDFLAENNGWDWNAGVVGNWRGISLGIYGTELEEGSKSASKGPLYNVYNYTKVNLSLGYSGNVYDISRGLFLRSRVAELEREQNQLRAEIAARDKRIEALEAQLRQAQAGELADIARRRQALESQIQEERDAIQRAEDRLKKLQEGQPPASPPTKPPSTTQPPR